MNESIFATRTLLPIVLFPKLSCPLYRKFFSLAVLIYVSVLASGSSHAADSDKVRPYFALRLGGGHFSNPDSVPGIELENPSQWPFQHFAFGANLNRYWGMELDVDYIETDVNALGLNGSASESNIGEYAIWHVLGQVRLRYPLLDDRLVPYLVAGAGLGIGEFNDREREFDFPFGAALETSLIGAVGMGLEYFVARNLALGVELKHIVGFENDVVVSGENKDLDLENTLLSAGIRLFFDGLGGATEQVPRAADSDRWRAYVVLRTGGAFFTHTGSPAALEILDNTVLDWSGAVGVNLSKHWGIELTGEQYETNLGAAGFGEVAEYSLWNVLIQLRWRYPLLDDRFVPYAIAGAGMGWTNVNNPGHPETTFPIDKITSNGPVGSFGAGVDYFLAENVALNLEARYTVPFASDAILGERTVTIENNAVLLEFGLRIYFP